MCGNCRSTAAGAVDLRLANAFEFARKGLEMAADSEITTPVTPVTVYAPPAPQPSAAPVTFPAALIDTTSDELGIRDLDIAERLGMANPRTIRTAISDNSEELQGFGSLMVRASNPTERGGRPGREFWLNEGQALTVCIREAARVRRALIDVFMQWRRRPAVNPMDIAEMLGRKNVPHHTVAA